MLKWILASLLVAAPALADAPTVTIARGEAVTLIVGDDDAPHQAERDAIAINDYETAAAVEFQRGDYNAAIGAKSLSMGRVGAGAIAPVPPPGKLVLRFVRTPDKDQSLLSIQNGLGRAFAYHATMVIHGKRIVTDVCVVPPGKIGNEFWPDPLDSLELSDIRLVAWGGGDRVTCG